MKRRVLRMFADFTVAALIVTIVWVMDYKIPQKGVDAVSLQETLQNMELDRQWKVESMMSDEPDQVAESTEVHSDALQYQDMHSLQTSISGISPVYRRLLRRTPMEWGIRRDCRICRKHCSPYWL